MQYVLAILVHIALLQHALCTDRCLPGCVCYKSSVRCTFLQLTKVPQDLPPDTTVLDLRFNRIQRIPRAAFDRLSSLKVLLLNNNEISDIASDAFGQLNDLSALYLYKNALQTLHPGIFKGLKNLQFLYLHSNNISLLHNDVFLDTPLLKRLYLNDNSLSTVPPGLFQTLSHLERLRLDSNTLVCDCRLLWLAQMLKQYSQEEEQVNCMYPSEMHGKPLRSLGMEELHCSAPSIQLEPRMLVVKAGDTARFTCYTEGNPKPRIVWLHNDAKIDPERRTIYHVFDNGTLMVDTADTDTQGYYECVAENDAGMARSAHRSELRYILDTQQDQGYRTDDVPRIARIPHDQTVTEGATLRLFCYAQGSPAPTVEWTLNNRPLTADGRTMHIRNHELTISPASRHHSGIFTCTALNQYGQVSASAQVYVHYAPEFTLRPTDRRANEGARVSLTCEATGSPRPIVHWVRRGVSLQASQRMSFAADSTVLTISPFLRDDVGDYACIAENSLGQISSTAHIELEAHSLMPPKITVGPRDQAVRPDVSVAFQCIAEGTPPPRIMWLFNGSPIRTVRGHFEVSTEGTLYVNEVQTADAGYYTCQAVNDVGAQSAEAALVVNELPPTEGPPLTRFPPTTRSTLDELVDRQVIEDAVARARESVDRNINRTREHLYDGKPKTARELLAIFRFPGPQTIELARAREIYDQTLNLIKQHVERGLQFNVTGYYHENFLSESHLQLISELTGCHIHRQSAPCNDMCFHMKYRTYDGTCNNFQQPQWGASFTAFKRILPPIYENGFNTPVGWNKGRLYYGFKKPSARLVSLEIVGTDRITPDRQVTHMLMQWGQFLDHDIDFSVMAPSLAQFQTDIDCENSCDNELPCFNIQVPTYDPRVRRGKCIEFERSSAICGSGATSILMNAAMSREQVNQITSFIDASNVYGSNEQDSLDLRDLFSDHGFLKFDVVSHQKKPYLPFNRNTPMDCRRNSSVPHEIRCFLAGDYRANEQLGLLAMHTLWLREHNRIAARLLAINPHWDGEKIYQETRKIVGAQIQHITYAHWLPKVLGEVIGKWLGLYKGYQPEVEPTASNEFATAALRFGHTLINPVLQRLNSSFQPISEGHLALHDAFFVPERLLSEGGIDPILRGLIATPAKQLKYDQFLNKELTERLFSKAEAIALDLAALNIQRGRDHGLPGYMEYRKWCNLSVADSWDGLADIPDATLRNKLRGVYGHPGNIDLWVGGLSEKLIPGGRVGPLMACLLADQFRRLRDGDRFWYENPGVFSPVQLAELKKTSLARVLCDNGDQFDRVQEDVFNFVGADRADFSACSLVPGLNLHLWQECCSGMSLNMCRYSPSKIHKQHSTSLFDCQQSERTSSTERSVDGPRKKRSVIASNISTNKSSEAAECVRAASKPSLADDVYETRFESLEQIIADLQKLLTTVNKRTKRLHMQLQRHKRGQCHDGRQWRVPGEKWASDECTTCHCQNGMVSCQRRTCLTALCQNATILPNECCPICISP